MDLNRLYALVAAPLASLFLVLVICTFYLRRPASVGMQITLATVRRTSNKQCDFLSDRKIVVQLRKDGSTWINETKESPEALRKVLGEIYAYRREKLVYMVSDADVSFADFARFYNDVESSTSNLHIGLRTRGLDKELAQCPEGGICGLDWLDREFSDLCLYQNIQLVHIPKRSGH